jgi:hypothetical protein
VIPDNMVTAIGISDAWVLAVLSSRVHVTWAPRAGGKIGMGNDPRYSKTRTFDPFPFPDPGETLKAQLRDAGERLDAFRKARQAEHPGLTLTQMYNVREALRASRALTPDEERIKDEGLILILNELHDEIDRLTFEAYGWPQGLDDEAILERLVALNAERAAEERRGQVRWLRPEYQKARAGVISLGPEQVEADLGFAAEGGLRAFPRDPVEQSAVVAAALAGAAGPITAAEIAAAYRKDKRTEARIAAILAAFVRTAFAATADSGRTFKARRAA